MAYFEGEAGGGGRTPSPAGGGLPVRWLPVRSCHEEGAALGCLPTPPSCCALLTSPSPALRWASVPTSAPQVNAILMHTTHPHSVPSFPCTALPLPLPPTPASADGRHLDAYDTHAAQYWPALQDFLDSLGPAQPLPPLPEGEQVKQAAQQAAQQRQKRQVELQPPGVQEMMGAAAAAGGVAAGPSPAAAAAAAEARKDQ